ncbi:MAG: hypothetical protein N2037_07065 [Acidimicrobiales bacterium]|nr:hypothetical protein [Acidimicrobiales bacterium]
MTTDRDRHPTWSEFISGPIGAMAAFLAVLAVPLVALGPTAPPLFLFGQFTLTMIALSAVVVLSYREHAPEMHRVRSRSRAHY